MSSTEFLLDPTNERFTILPLGNYPHAADMWNQYKNAVSTFWTFEEVDLTKDTEDWEKLSSDEQHFIKHVLAFFAASDGIVNKNIDNNFVNEVTPMEARCFYGFQIAMENIHGEMYSELINAIIKNEKERKRLFEAVKEMPIIKQKAHWAFKWMNPETASFAERVVAFCCVEGIQFSGSFCAIFWLKKRGLMPGLCFSNELISRDEGLHTDFGILMYNCLNKKLTQERVYEIVESAVKDENEFICNALPCRLIGMNSDMMSQYIEYVADRLIVQLGYAKRWNSKNPFDFMETNSLRIKSNFFEKKVGEYVKTGVGKTIEDNTFCISDDF